MGATDVSTTTARIYYCVGPNPGARAYQNTNADPTTGVRACNFTRVEHPMVVENIRGKEDEYTLDNAGFQFHRSPAKHAAFTNDEDIKIEYYAESIELLKDVTGASKVVVFHHNVIEDSENLKFRQPVPSAHVDDTTKGAIGHVHRHLPPDEATKLLKKRFQVINLWRPINHPAYEWPLALCDYRSVDPKQDALPITVVHPYREGEAYGIQYNPNHKWKYLRDMAPEEVVLIKCFDSLQNGSVAVYTPHTSFVDPTSPPDAPFRESIELRALVFYE